MAGLARLMPALPATEAVATRFPERNSLSLLAVHQRQPEKVDKDQEPRQEPPQPRPQGPPPPAPGS